MRGDMRNEGRANQEEALGVGIRGRIRRKEEGGGGRGNQVHQLPHLAMT